MVDNASDTGVRGGIWVLVVALAVLGAASGSDALTVYRIGGEGLPEPDVGEATFVPLSWDEVLTSDFGAHEAVDIQPAHIAPEMSDPSVNLAPDYEEEGFYILRGPWQRPQSMMAWQPERFSWRMIDGDSTTVYECHTFRHIGNLCGSTQYTYMFELGKQVYLNRVRYFTQPKSRFQIPRFLIGSNDGNQLLDGSRDHLPAGQQGDPFDFDILHDGPGAELVDIPFTPTPTERLLFRVFRNLDGGSVRADWEIVEFEFYATGFAPSARYTSPVVPLGEEVSIGGLTWSGDQPDGTSVDLSMRSGSDGDPNVYWRHTFRGFEQVSYSASGAPLTRALYEKLELAEMGDITLDLENWDAWSAAYDFSAGRGPAAAVRPRTHVQFDVTFESLPEVGGRLDYVQFATSPRLVTEVLAEIDPAEASPDEVTAFRYLVRPQWEPGEAGFDGIVVRTEARIAGVDGVVISTPAGTDTLAQDVDWVLTPVPAGENGFAVRLTDPIDSADESFNLVQVLFRAQIYAYDTLFSGSLTSSDLPLDVPQPVVQGDADELADGNSLRVALSTIPREPIQSLRLSTPVFTPNGDGIHDRVIVEYELLNLSGGTPTTLRVFDLSGRIVSEAFRSDGVVSGRSQFAWDGTNGLGALLPPGLYVLQLRVEADDGEDSIQRLVSLAY